MLSRELVNVIFANLEFSLNMLNILVWFNALIVKPLPMIVIFFLMSIPSVIVSKSREYT